MNARFDKASRRTRRGILREVWRRPGGAYGLIAVAAVLVAAALSLVWTPYPLLQQNVVEKWQGPSPEHWLGTDQIGRDTFSWLMAGARTTVFVSVLSAVIAGALGVVLGALGALTPRWVSESLAVLIDVLIAFPTLLIAMLFAASLGGSLWVVVAAVGIAGGVSIARVVRPEIRIADRSDFVLAARAAGVRRTRIIRRHIVPNVAPVMIVQLSLIAAVAVLAEAGLSYLGYGAPAGTPSWGRSLAESQRFIGVQPVAVLWPGLTITLTVLGLSLLGDSLREAADPRLRRSRPAAGAPEASSAERLAPREREIVP
ncbi:ABC transporter permease [Microbacterium sp. SORGH_AS_0862]|uniref:ABC transporter permease n=1 Tax=Microbacterium sp. SORGH_AS_0862 TaxID=3041789 RepID=UPI0027909446|nr:ABC transporter permease [Microbacterium sp. SORGH_AS_0862]MDQ1205715.1 peptide/nickel transport system permease protein [Microbacterium sp. SORGH_AS_0862]